MQSHENILTVDSIDDGGQGVNNGSSTSADWKQRGARMISKDLTITTV